MRRALVTGATGGLGLTLTQMLLAEGYSVRATGRNSAVGARLRAMGASFFSADLTLQHVVRPLVTDVDVVFHAAGLSSPWGTREAFERINVGATGHLVDAARDAGCGRFIFISTPSIYGEARDRLALTEASPIAQHFANTYAATKFAAEQIVLAANTPGFVSIAIRPRALVGPDDQVLLPRLIRIAAKGYFPLFRSGQALIELTDVRDAASAALAADRAGKTAFGRAFNVSGGRPARMVDTLDLIFQALELTPKYVRLPYAPMACAAGLAEFVCAQLPQRPEPPATVYSLTNLAFSQTFDLTAARTILGWQPRYSPVEAIARTATAWRQRAPM